MVLATADTSLTKLKDNQELSINGNLPYDSGNSNRASVKTSRGGMGRKVGGRFKREGTYVYLWLIHVDVWQKPTQFCKAIILQLKKFFLIKKKTHNQGLSNYQEQLWP